MDNYNVNGKRLSSGDPDARLWEIVADKADPYLLASISDGGLSGRAYEFFTGGPGYFTVGSTCRFIRNKFERRYNRHSSDGAMIVFCAHYRSSRIGYPRKHCGTILDMDFHSNRFTYVNPWDTSDIKEASIDDLVRDIQEMRLLVRQSTMY